MPFQPGVAIDWGERSVIVDARVVLRRGPIEFLACFEGKEHESIVRLEAAGTHIFMALGLTGFSPGHPPAWDSAQNRFRPPTGDLLDLSFEWEQGGRRRRAAAHAWTREIEYARVPLPLGWVFAGSVVLPDGTLACDRSGVGIPVVDFGDSLICMSSGHTSENAGLWLEANPEAIPPERTAVKLVIRRARAREYLVTVDFRGVAFADGRYVSAAELADLILLARRFDPAAVQTITLEGTLGSDERRLRKTLGGLGVPADAVRFERKAAPASRPAKPG